VLTSTSIGQEGLDFIELGAEVSERQGSNGGADFYAPDVAGLRREGAASLKVLLDMCPEDGVEPRRQFSGKFHLRVPPELHAAIVEAAAADGKSLNQWVTDELRATVTGAA